jgi:hypothetical protein
MGVLFIRVGDLLCFSVVLVLITFLWPHSIAKYHGIDDVSVKGSEV